MPGRYFPPTFNQLPADQQFVAGAGLRIDGRDYLPGEPFDRSKASRRLLQVLYTGRRIARAPSPAASQNPGPAATPTPPGAEQLTMRHVGFGKWHVMRGEQRIAGPMAKAEAEQFCESAA